MRNKIDYGIDLGTTNSAIARMENGLPVIKKSDTSKDIMPSSVHFTRRQDVLVGETAVNQGRNDNMRALRTFEKEKTNTFSEFKRTMGTTHTYESANMNRRYSSEELSAEVLKALKSFVQDENLSSIVITVPAKFLNPQKEATIAAARLAGFKHIELLQEPVAAATGYGLTAKQKDGFWLVFDFGGGTFDAALVRAEEGILKVKDTEGDNWLGGKNLDEAMVDQLIFPYLSQQYAMADILADTGKKEILRNALKPMAETAKISLSFKDSVRIISELNELPFEDANGEEPEIDVMVTQVDMEKVMSPFFQRAIDITLALLKRNNLSGTDLDALILVGGPTYSPILRRMLREQVTTKVDTSVDPMTAVAMGAALFASTLSISDEVLESARDKTKLQLELKYAATTVDATEMLNLKILPAMTAGVIPAKVYADIVRSDGGWSSGKKAISEKAALLELRLQEGRSNSFQIRAYDELGNQIDCQPDGFSILQGIGIGEMTTLPYYIGLGLYFRSEDKDLFQPIKGLEKNKKLPSVGVANGLKTRTTIRPGMASDVIRIPIYQGEYAATGTNPALNNKVNEIVISGESLPALLPDGSDVDITIKVDRSEKMQFIAYFPLLDHTEELKVDIQNIQPPTVEALQKEIAAAQLSAKNLNAAQITNELNGLESQLEHERGSADGKMRILENLRKSLLQLEGEEKKAEWPAVESQLKQSMQHLEDLIQWIKTNKADKDLEMSQVDLRQQEFKQKMQQVMREESIKEARFLKDDIEQFDFNLRSIVSENAMDGDFIKELNRDFNNYNWKDRNKARQLINQCLQLVNEGKTSAIRPILVQILGLMPDDQKPKETLEIQ